MKNRNESRELDHRHRLVRKTLTSWQVLDLPTYVKPILTGVLVVGATIALTSAPAFADQDARSRDGISGTHFHGEQHIQTDPDFTNGEPDMVTPAQALFYDGNFLGTGLYKGDGANGSGGGGSCVADHDANWSVYVDGQIGSLYFCYSTSQENLLAAGDWAPFSLIHDECSDGVKHWRAFFDGQNNGCYHMGHGVASQFGAMAEISPSGCKNIDVKFREMQFYESGESSWKNFGTGTRHRDPDDYGCFYNESKSDNDFWIWHGTMS